MKQITYDQVRKILTEQLLIKHNRIWLFAPNYSALNEQEYITVIKSIEPIEQLLIPEVFDCDSFAHVFSAFVKLQTANQYPKPVSFGEITIRHALSNDIHTLNFLIIDGEEARYFDPQPRLFVNGVNYQPIFARI